MSSDILDPSALISALPTLLPGTEKKLETPQDAIAVLLHTVMNTVGFRLVGLDDSSSDSQYENNVLPAEWKRHAPESFSFRYRHEQSSLVFLLKIVKLSKRLVIHGIALEDDKTTTLDISIADFTSSSSFPFDISSNSSPLVHGFISSARVKDLVGQFKLQVLQKLVPSLRKEGYEENKSSTVPASQAPTSHDDPLPSRPAPIPTPDPQQPFSLPHPNFGPGNPLEIGRADLEPMGGQNPFAPPSLFPGSSGGSGMYVGPSHPMFRDRLDPLSQGGIGGDIGGFGPRWGGDGYLPPMGAPPGARFDPVGPIAPGRGGFNSPGGTGRGRGFGPGGGGGAAGPDNDEFMPPGMRDMYS